MSKDPKRTITMNNPVKYKLGEVWVMLKDNQKEYEMIIYVKHIKYMYAYAHIHIYV